MLFFSLIFWSPRVLQGMGSYAIRTRRRSPNALFNFHIFSKKVGNWVQQGPILEPFLSQNWAQVTKKGVPEIALRSGTPQDSNRTLLTSPEAPGDDASRAHFQQQKQQLRQQQQQLQQQLQKLLLQFSFCSKFLFAFGYFSMSLLDFSWKHVRMLALLHLLQQRAADLTRPGQRPGEFRNHSVRRAN